MPDMHLTQEEEKIYDGELGWAYQISMRILVKLGDLFGADRLIPIESAHISGVSYKTIGDAPIDFLEAIADSGGRTKVSSTVNPSGFDLGYLEEMKIPQGVREKQQRIIDLYERMGVNPVLTCTPYYLERPRRGSHLAWAESSAVVYANSILGSWTNREGGPSALAAALIGKTPNYGVHQPENRKADILVKVEPKMENEMEFGALGIYLGKILGDKVPVFDGLPSRGETGLKQLGAALASSGMTSIFHRCERCDERLEKITVERNDVEKMIDDLSTASEPPNMVFIGCPHCSLSEVRAIAEIIKGRRVRDGVRLWVCTSRHVRAKAGNYVDIIEAAGGHVLCDTCAVVTWIREMGVEAMMTNSAKTAYYAPTLSRVNAILAPLRECINTACRS